MKNEIQEILKKDNFTHSEIVTLLSTPHALAEETLFKKALAIKEQYVGRTVYYRGLIEFSNICQKDCLYCGIRSSYDGVTRYTMTEDEVLDAAKFALDTQYASVVIQSGENNSPEFIDSIDRILKRIEKETEGKIRVTLSCGEQSRETYQRWYDSGARRYLLRIEASNQELYEKLHPKDAIHLYDDRIQALKDLKDIGYQTGSGMMVGAPFQTLDHLAEDILFLKKLDIDMIGLGPFIEHADTPLYEQKETLKTKEERFNLTLNAIAILRILFKDINIASATALQAINPAGREIALLSGSNVIMPSLTPTKYRSDYLLYENKPCVDEERSQCKDCLEVRISMYGEKVGYGEWGDSKHFVKRKGL